jgi:hypothetical protein
MIVQVLEKIQHTKNDKKRLHGNQVLQNNALLVPWPLGVVIVCYVYYLTCIHKWLLVRSVTWPLGVAIILDDYKCYVYYCPCIHKWLLIKGVTWPLGVARILDDYKCYVYYWPCIYKWLSIRAVPERVDQHDSVFPAKDKTNSIKTRSYYTE